MILTFFAGFGLGWQFLKERIKPAIQETMSELVDEMVDAVYPCKLIATIRYDQPQDSHVVDMSRYDTLGIVGITIDKKEKAESEADIELDGKPMIYQTAVVYRLGEHWFWKVL